jgi:DivIVA domain-containing protein
VVTVLEILAVLIVLFVAAAVATREGEVLVDAPRDAADLALPSGPLHSEDVARVRFGLTVRGYRMAEVDRVLERLAEELAARDARVADLEDALGAGRAPGSERFSPSGLVARSEQVSASGRASLSEQPLSERGEPSAP